MKFINWSFLVHHYLCKEENEKAAKTGRFLDDDSSSPNCQDL